MNTLEEQSVSPFKFSNDKFGELREINVALLLIENVFGEFRNTFGIRLSFKNISLVLENSFQFTVICNDPVMNDHKFGLGITPNFVNTIAFRRQTCEDDSSEE